VAEQVVDARGLGCPQPVVLARKAIQQPGAEAVRVVVDSEISVENIRRMATTLKWEVSVRPQAGEFHLLLARGEAAEAESPAATPGDRPLQVLAFITTDVLGTGDPELGAILMRAFVKTLAELEPLPGRMIFVNAGVRLTTRGSPLVDDLKKLESRGVEILSCGTCLDFYRLVDSLQVGGVTNMFEIVAALAEADRVLRP